MTPELDTEAQARTVRHIVALADGDVHAALSLLLAEPIGPTLDDHEYDPAAWSAPDGAALALAQLVTGEDESTAVELLQLAGYDARYAAALMLCDPRFTPHPDLVRALLAEAGLPEYDPAKDDETDG